jgi:hypothetical protein
MTIWDLLAVSQRVVDRRFNRARYNADQIVTAFAARLQDAVDLGAIRDELTNAVHAALEPAHLSVWIKEPPRRRGVIRARRAARRAAPTAAYSSRR